MRVGICSMWCTRQLHGAAMFQRVCSRYDQVPHHAPHGIITLQLVRWYLECYYKYYL